VHIIPHDQGIERHRATGLLAVGQSVTLKRINGRLMAHDSCNRAPNQTEITASQRPASRGTRRSR
jgi:hypothetical protein